MTCCDGCGSLPLLMSCGIGRSGQRSGISCCGWGVPQSGLALLRDGRPVLAVIDVPFLGERYHPIEGKGAYTGTRPLKASTTTRLRDAVVAIGDYATGDGADRKNELRLAATIQLTPRVHRIRMLGTAAVDLAWVADGRLDASVTLGNKPWDTVAGVLIAREAGAAVTDADGQPHDLNSAATIAAAPALISQLIPLIQAADLTALQDSQTGFASPYKTLDEILSQARHLIFDFDGPVCDLTAAMPPDTADQLRAAASAETPLPAAIAAISDPIEIIARPSPSAPPWPPGLTPSSPASKSVPSALPAPPPTCTRPSPPAVTPGERPPSSAATPARP